MSPRIRIIMAISALVLLVTVFILLLAQSNWHENWFLRQEQRSVPALGPTEARPVALDFTWTGSEGRPLRLSDFRGKVVYLNFWATWCEPCRVELPLIEEMQKNLTREKLETVLINLDHGEANQTEAKELQQTLAPSPHAIYDNTKALQELMNVQALPFHMIVDRSGRVAAAFYAPLEKDLPKVERMIKDLIQE